MLREVFVLVERWITRRASYNARTHTLLQMLDLGAFSFWESLRDYFRMWMGVQSCFKKSFQSRDYVILVKDGRLLWQHVLSGISWESAKESSWQPLILQRCLQFKHSLSSLVSPAAPKGEVHSYKGILKNRKQHWDFFLFREKSFPDLLPSRSTGVLI